MDNVFSDQQNLDPTIYTSPEKSKSREKSSIKRPQSDLPVCANFASSKLTIAAGVAIFHVVSSRVVVCWHSRDKYWFLPKGRRDAGEDSGAGAEREGFEESGYRNRLLPIPMKHRQPKPHRPAGAATNSFATEPIWTQLLPLTASSQYLLFWYIAETLPPDVEAQMNLMLNKDRTDSGQAAYRYPPKYPQDLTLSQRSSLEPEGYEPVHHKNTGVDAEEALYQSFLLPIGEAMQKLRGHTQEDVIRGGWEAICLRQTVER
ncbi:MAG: hypothetical protein M1812_004472 [Candelaria pacifica]|nr:MAG: hypothetical protein M1812_004472 [Candelaria pacifica]